MYKTINEWEDIFELKVIDLDGFDRKDPNLFDKLFSKKEFENGLVESTITGKLDINGSNPVIKIYKVYYNSYLWCAYDNIDSALINLRAEIEEENYLEFKIVLSFMRKKTFDNLPEFEG